MISEKPNGFAGAIVALIEALIIALIASGVIQMNDVTAQLWVNVAIAIVAVATPIIGFWFTKAKTTPLVEPKDSDGTALLRSDGKMPLMQEQRMVSKKS